MQHATHTISVCAAFCCCYLLRTGKTKQQPACLTNCWFCLRYMLMLTSKILGKTGWNTYGLFQARRYCFELNGQTAFLNKCLCLLCDNSWIKCFVRQFLNKHVFYTTVLELTCFMRQFVNKHVCFMQQFLNQHVCFMQQFLNKRVFYATVPNKHVCFMQQFLN